METIGTTGTSLGNDTGDTGNLSASPDFGLPVARLYPGIGAK